MKLIWALAFASFWSTTTCIGAFHGRRYHGSWKMPRHFLCVGALMQVLLILGFWTGLTQKSSWSIAMMILICAQFAPLLWAVLLVMKLDCQFAAMDPQAQSLTEKERSRKTWCMAAAMLELPGGCPNFNSLFSSFFYFWCQGCSDFWHFLRPQATICSLQASSNHTKLTFSLVIENPWTWFWGLLKMYQKSSWVLQMQSSLELHGLRFWA